MSFSPSAVVFMIGLILIMNEYRSVTLLGLIQVTIIFGGWALTTVHLKYFGYPNELIAWNPSAVFVRNWGFLLIFIPVIWSVVVVCLESRPSFRIRSEWVAASGLFLAIGFFFFFFFTVTDVGSRKIFIYQGTSHLGAI